MASEIESMRCCGFACGIESRGAKNLAIQTILMIVKKGPEVHPSLRRCFKRTGDRLESVWMLDALSLGDYNQA